MVINLTDDMILQVSIKKPAINSNDRKIVKRMITSSEFLKLENNNFICDILYIYINKNNLLKLMYSKKNDEELKLKY